MITASDEYGCGQCGIVKTLCLNCGNCAVHCRCTGNLFDADELGLDPETDNSPNAGSRHA